MTYTKTQLRKMKAAKLHQILEDNQLFAFGYDKQSAIDAIIANQNSL